MIDLNSAKADEVLKVLLYIAPILGLLTARTIMIAQIKMDGRPMFYSTSDKLTRFTVNDFAVFALTLIPSSIVVVTALNSASFAYILDVLTALRSDWGAMGWAMSFVWWLHVIAPFAVGLMLYIGRRRRFKKYPGLASSRQIYLG